MAKALRTRKNEPLTDKQRDFCREYVKDFNGYRAALRAKYARTSARMQASRLLTKDNVQAEVRRLANRGIKKLEVTAERIVDKFARLADANVADYLEYDGKGRVSIELMGLERDITAGIASVKIGDHGKVESIKLASRERCLEVLARLLKIEPPKKVILEHEGEVQHTHRIRQEYTLTTEELRKQISDYLVTHKADGSKAG